MEKQAGVLTYRSSHHRKRFGNSRYGISGQKVVQLVKEALAEDSPAMDILEKGLVPGVQARG